LVHHSEADGICSAALAVKGLEKLNFEVEVVSLEKTYSEILEEIFNSNYNLIAFTDLAGSHADLICELNRDNIPTIILDHHEPKESTKPSVFNLSPDFYGLKGDEVSASSVSYFFAKTISKEIENFAHLALIGSAEIPELKGLNLEPVKDGLKNKVIEKVKNDYKVKPFKNLSYKRLSTLLSVLGSVGYYRDGSKKGLKLCLQGWDEKIEKEAIELENKRRITNRKLLAELKNKGLNVDGQVQWFHAKNNYKGMGVKVIGSFCSYLRYQRKIVKPNLYLLGFMYMEREIPGFKPLKKDYTKVSARVPFLLEKQIKEGKKPALSKVLPEACEQNGGFGDGHSLAASGIIIRGKEKEFISSFNNLL
jgi:single-stranded DNA-specific DHH superfamily exonuclease